MLSHQAAPLCDPGCFCDKQPAHSIGVDLPNWHFAAAVSGTTATLLVMVPNQSEAASWGMWLLIQFLRCANLSCFIAVKSQLKDVLSFYTATSLIAFYLQLP